MEEVPVPKGKKEEDKDHPNTIVVKSESESHVLARFEQEEPNVQADMVLAQTCSLLDEHGTQMELRRKASGEALKPTDWIACGSVVYLCKAAKRVQVQYRSSSCSVEADELDRPLILIVACEHFGLTPSDFELRDLGPSAFKLIPCERDEIKRPRIENPERGYCFIRMPDATTKRFTITDSSVQVETMRRALCFQFGFSEEEYQFVTDFGYPNVREGMTYVLLKRGSAEQ